jgi:uncharacterized protein (TIGR03437 family)
MNCIRWRCLGLSLFAIFALYPLLLPVDSHAQGVITTVAGSTWVFRGDGGPAANAPLGPVWGVAIDSAHNLFAADEGNNLVVKITPDGVLTVVAGNGQAGFGGDGGPATAGSLNVPRGVTVDGAGNLYIADFQNNRIRAVRPDGTIFTAAGNGNSGVSGDGGPATRAAVGGSPGIVVDAAGNLYIAQLYFNRVRKVSSDGTITTVAGNGVAGFSGDGLLAIDAQLYYPEKVFLDAVGNLYIADTINYRVRKVSPGGIITTVAGTGVARFSGDGGPATAASFYAPRDVVPDSTGSLFIADWGNNRIRKVDSNGIISTIAGNGAYRFSGDGGPATSALLQLAFPTEVFVVGVAVDALGNLYLADCNNHRVRRVGADGIINTVAGNGTAGFSGDGGPAVNAQIGYPKGLAVDGNRNLYIADRWNGRIRKVSPDGIIATAAGTGSGVFSGDGGPATRASLYNPYDVAEDASGNLYILDMSHYRVRKVNASGIISTVAGNGVQGFSGDGGPATSAPLDPHAIAVDTGGNLYISDDQRIRKVDASGVVRTVAGNGTPGFSGDGGPATTGSLYYPEGITVDGAGNLYIADSYNHRIRKVSAAGVISTVAGDGAAGFSGDGGPATRASLNFPSGVTTDPAGNLYITDLWNDRIRKVLLAAPAVNAGGVVLGAGYAQAPLAPGTIISLFGQNLSAVQSQVSSFPLPRNMNGVRVLVNGQEAPLFYISTTQINAQLPVELSPGTTAQVVVENNGMAGAPQTIQVAAVSPGVFTLGPSFGQQGAVLIANTNLLAMPATAGVPSRPAQAGEIVSIFCTGLGATDPAVATGNPGPSSPPATVKTPAAVSIGGLLATVSFAGLAPGYAGLYQVNAQVPAGVTPGDAVPVIITQGGASTNTATLAVR